MTKASERNSDAREDALYVGSLEKGLRVLGAFGGGEQFKTLREIGQACGMDKSAAQRFTHTLVQLGYLEKCPDTKRFSLGKRVLELSFNYLRANTLIEAASPVLLDLQKATGQRVNLSLFDDTWIIYAIRQISKREYYYSSLIGRRMPVWCTSGGRIMLSHLPREEVNDILKRCTLKPLTPRTIHEPARIRARIAEAREKGYALTAEETVLGEQVVAGAILGPRGMPLAAVHIAGSLSEFTPNQFEKKFGPLAAETAHALSRHG
ncbi:IclR family transcriptional regulator [Ramlibacter henchirensis]|uniref:IclR family transcriptional regulator n=1 Tax=Ramlibacter henchirensis TaxID=204072 RepID=A0A4Z0BU37_9BURK|nr:IclR family transcriptional regulator C-terminal domain-containing protein [Ramlibacter henchirensis]TFZ02816.1 IclR family transcriptional regulator [Ramlibacter henchirensis]